MCTSVQGQMSLIERSGGEASPRAMRAWAEKYCVSDQQIVTGPDSRSGDREVRMYL